MRVHLPKIGIDKGVNARAVKCRVRN